MWTIISCIRDDHDLRLVALAALVCVLAAGTAIRFHRSSKVESGTTRVLLNLGVGLIAGGGVWATHFVAMLAYSVSLPLRFDITDTVLSLLIAVLGMGVGFSVAKSRAGVARLLAAGAIVGLSIVALHFIGIGAIRSIFGIHWQPAYVVGSILAAVLGAASALVVEARVGGWRGWLGATLCLVLGIVGLHFTAMSAMEVIPDLSPAALNSATDRIGVAFMTGAVALTLIAAGGGMALVQAQTRQASILNLEAAFGGLPIGMAMFNRTGQLVLWNTAFESLLGHLSVVPARGMTRRELLAQELAARQQPLDQAMETWVGDIDAGRRSGLAREWSVGGGHWLRMEIFDLPSGESVTVVSDVTQSRTYAEAMTEARDRAEAASRAKSEFLANMSHEIRTPLNGILGMAQVMNQDDLSDAQRGRLTTIRESGKALMTILNDLLDLSKVQAGKLELNLSDVDVAGLVASVASTFEGLASTKDIAIETAIDPDARGIWRVDESRLRQVLGNLVNNAVKFTHQGQVRIAATASADGLLIEVADEGIGIAADDIPTLFEKFTQADATATRRYGGTGLGLAICKSFADLMGATLSVTSEPGVGSCFRIALPAEQLAASAQAPAAAPDNAELEDRALRILAAEDNPTNQLVLRALLQEADLIIVGNGRLAVEAAGAGVFDVILMDIQMPEMNGVEATRAIRALEAAAGRAATPIVALTANVMHHQTAEYLAAGMDAWVAKPIEVEKLYACLTTTLLRRRQVA